jgi:aminoglycoside phosphotransferase (APT) family kinase protein
MIPQEKSAAVTRALREAFGVTALEGIRPMAEGNSTTLKYRIVVEGAPYLLRIILRTDDPTRHFANARAAAEGGVAPHVRYANVEDKIVISDFVEGVPFPAAEALTRIPATLRALHALPPFADVPNQINTSCMFLLNGGPGADGFIAKFGASKFVPEAESEEVFARFRELAAAYPRRESDWVSSHNDLKPENLLYDGERAWLVDWEAAFRNDRYQDLAVIATWFVTNEEEERTYLREYFGRPAEEHERARFFLMQQVFHLFHAMAFLMVTAARGPIELNGELPEFGEFFRRNWAGEVSLKENAMRVVYARLHWEALVRNVRSSRFEEALRTVSG